MSSSVARNIPRLDPKRSAVFVCDMQERFRTAIHQFDNVTNTGVKILKAADLLDLKTFVTEQNPKALGQTIAPLSSLLSPLNPLMKEMVYPKTKFSMCLEDICGDWLNELKSGKAQVDQVIIFGIESHVCVLQTTLDLLEHGAQVWIPVDGVSSCNAGEISPALNRMRSAGAQITTSESLIFELMKDSKHPNFKLVSGLIKEEKDRTKTTLESLLAKI